MLDSSEFRTHPFGNTYSANRKTLIRPRLSAPVGETQEVKCLGATLATTLSSFVRKSAEFD